VQRKDKGGMLEVLCLNRQHVYDSYTISQCFVQQCLCNGLQFKL